MIGGQTGGVLSNSSASNSGNRGIRLWEAEDFNVHDCFISLSGKEGIWFQNSDNINFTNIIVKNNNTSEKANIGGILIENSSGIKFTSCQSYDDRDTPIQEYGIRMIGAVDFVEIINCILTPNEKSSICNDAGAVITEKAVISEAMLLRF